MTLYYTLAFILLVFEMVTFLVLAIPLPFTMRRKLFKFLAENPIVAQIQYGLKITFIFIAVLFVDSVQRMLRVVSDSEATRGGGTGIHADVRTETNYAARKFYTQRNMYLTGFTLFLSLILSRTYSLIQDLIHAQEELVALKKGADKADGGLEAKHKQEIETLKKQAAQQHAEYNRLSDELNKAQGNVSDKKAD